MNEVQAGIEQIEIYEGRLRLDLGDLASRRGATADSLDRIMTLERSVFPAFEDAVTLGANAARRLLARCSSAADVELVLVNTESAVDLGKSAATWIHGLLGLSPRCRAFEIKQACYGGLAALRTAASWVSAGARPGKKALVISADMSTPHLDDPMEYIAGGCGLAMLVSASPHVLELRRDAGYFTKDVADVLRPLPGLELADPELSMFSYLDALEGAYRHYAELVPHDLNRDFRRHVYHAPFPAMTRQAHRNLMGLLGIDRKGADASFQERVLPGLCFGRRMGTVYGASNFISLLGHLASDAPPAAGDRISFFAYGSGCVGEFYAGDVGASGVDAARALGIGERLTARVPITFDDYEAVERQRGALALAANSDAWEASPAKTRAAYDGSGLVVLRRVENHRRTYGITS